MLYIVLVLVLAAFGLLIASLATSTTLFAWVSVGLSVLAAAVLVLDWWRRRRRQAAADVEDTQADDETDDDESPAGIGRGESTADVSGDSDTSSLVRSAGDGDSADNATEPAGQPAGGQPSTSADETTVLPRIDDAGGDTAASRAHGDTTAAPESEQEHDRDLDDDRDLDLNTEPDEEDTDAADLLTVSELDVEVLVVDERPRYHLTGCRWLADKPTLPLAVSEARQLGFTPCVVCTPDARLVAAHRKQRSATRRKT
ncbi:MAG: hypothetical protein J2O49_06760 [Sciscionella sp.]|nr:hypothetical protein [Sciscionella sp.]